MFLSAAVGNENDIAAVRTDCGLFIETGVCRELPGRSALEISEPQILFASGLKCINNVLVGGPRKAIRSVIIGESKLCSVVDVRHWRNPNVCFPFSLNCDHS